MAPWLQPYDCSKLAGAAAAAAVCLQQQQQQYACSRSSSSSTKLAAAVAEPGPDCSTPHKLRTSISLAGSVTTLLPWLYCVLLVAAAAAASAAAAAPSGDTRGRRLTLLLSIVFMAVPTVLIGCLPSYAHIGVAAPVLLSLLRLVQGLAMGGEFGSALVSATP